LKKGIDRGLIVGWGFDHEQFQEGRMPTRKDLDTISPTIPSVASKWVTIR